MPGVFDGLLSELSHVEVERSVGRVVGVSGGTVRVSGLIAQAQVGDAVSFSVALGGEIIALTPDAEKDKAERKSVIAYFRPSAARVMSCVTR